MVNSYQHRWLRGLGGLFCAIGVLGIADGIPGNWMLLAIAALLLAVMLPALFTRRSPILAEAPHSVEATR